MNLKGIFTEDENLLEIIEKVSIPLIVSSKNVFHDLVSCIIEQQIHYRSTKNIFKNLLKKADIEELTLENFSVFDEKALQFIKISSNKAETISRVCDFFEQNTVDWENLSDVEVREKLSSIKGVGSWTIDMILLYTLGRENVFPVEDFHLKQIMVQVYNLNENSKLKSQMISISEKWKDKKSIATLCLLAYKKGLKKS
jgi:DNA-3-methyladenine glycosylase II